MIFSVHNGLKRKKGLTTKKSLQSKKYLKKSKNLITTTTKGLKKTKLKRTKIKNKSTKKSLQSNKKIQIKPTKIKSSLQSRTTLKSNSKLKAKTKLRNNPKRISEASLFHKEVFGMFGNRCVLCTRRHPAVHAAHVIKRSALGKLRYASPHFARPAHEDCHRNQEANKMIFSLPIRIDATRAYNRLNRVKKIPEPTQ